MFGFFKKKKNADERFSQPLSPEADKFLAAVLAEYGEKEEVLEKNWRMARSAEYALNDETGLFNMELEDGAAMGSRRADSWQLQRGRSGLAMGVGQSALR